MQRLTLNDTTLTLHSAPHGKWFTINHNDEFYYSGTVKEDKDDTCLIFDDWTMIDVLEDCPEAVDVIEQHGFTVYI